MRSRLILSVSRSYRLLIGFNAVCAVCSSILGSDLHCRRCWTLSVVLPHLLLQVLLLPQEEVQGLQEGPEGRC